MDHVVVFSAVDTLAHGAAQAFCASASRAIARHGRFTVALAGGRTPKALYQLLSSDTRYRDFLRWKNIHFFFGDERHVPPGHPDSNFRMASNALFKRAPVPPENVSRVLAELADPGEAARRYEQTLGAFFPVGPEREEGFPVFDLVLLGMGPDGHTASLFPGSDALVERENWVVPNWVAKFAAWRITLTFPVLNHAREVMVLVTGEDKAPVIKEILGKPDSPRRYPIQRVAPRTRHKLWLVDRPAFHLVESAGNRSRATYSF